MEVTNQTQVNQQLKQLDVTKSTFVKSRAKISIELK